MIQFFYGNDSFRLKEALGQPKDAIKSTDPEELKKTSLFDSGPLLMEIIDKDFIIPEIRREVIFYWLNPDKRTKLFKELMRFKSRKFDLLSDRELIDWICSHCKIKLKAAELLGLYIGNDLWMMQNELNKLSAYIGYQRSISVEDVKALIKPKITASIWDLNLKSILELDEDQQYLFNMLVWHWRTILQIKTDQTQGLHPFVIKKNQAKANRYSLAELKTIYQQLLDLDWQTKTGQIERPALWFELLYSEK